MCLSCSGVGWPPIAGTLAEAAAAAFGCGLLSLPAEPRNKYPTAIPTTKQIVASTYAWMLVQPALEALSVLLCAIHLLQDPIREREFP
jgi:hypothetical protein